MLVEVKCVLQHILGNWNRLQAVLKVRRFLKIQKWHHLNKLYAIFPNVTFVKRLFQTITIKNNHIRVIHGEEKSFECNVCSQKFGQKPELVRHTKNHHQGDCHICKNCAKSFTSYDGLNIHIKNIHERQMNYECDSCRKSFTQSGNLRKHIKTVHEGQRNFKCNS